MSPILTLVAVAAVVGVFLVFWIRAMRERRELERSSITVEALHAMMAAQQEVLLYDVRQPLDLLADSEIISGARRVPPKEIEENAKLLPRDREVVVYCTCPSDATARVVARRARELNFTQVKFLKGGLAAWKQSGYPVEPYRDAFHLDTAT
jgi:rhodanese-related sulfurtransferase